MEEGRGAGRAVPSSRVVSTRRAREWAEEALPAVRMAGPLAAKGEAKGKCAEEEEGGQGEEEDMRMW
jgi:hypothetical protein